MTAFGAIEGLVSERRHESTHVLQAPLAAPRSGIMLHYDDSSRDDWALEWFSDPRCTNGYTWVVLDDGRIVELAHPTMRTPHAGACLTPMANSRFYGIAATTNGLVPATAAQLDSIVALCAALLTAHGWDEASRIVGHDAQAIWTPETTSDARLWGRLGRKVDPTGTRPDGKAVIDVLAIAARVTGNALTTADPNHSNSQEAHMPRAIGIQTHDFFKLGRTPPTRDRRNLKFGAVLRAAPKLPASYDFDITHAGIPTPMFANDVYGDCVIAGRAHQTLRFEDIEQGSVLMITDGDVTKEYFKETGGPDTGLNVLTSLKAWRSAGWQVGKRAYAINAFAELNRASRTEIKQAIYANVGVGLGLNLPLSAQKQVQSGQPWDVTTGPSAAPGSWGGHYVYVSGYSLQGPVCVTWGRKQQMSWAWFAKYCDEAYATFDAKNQFRTAMIDRKAIKQFLTGL